MEIIFPDNYGNEIKEKRLAFVLWRKRKTGSEKKRKRKIDRRSDIKLNDMFFNEYVCPLAIESGS